MARFVIFAAVMVVLMAPSASVAMVPPGGIGAGSEEPVVFLDGYEYDPYNDLTQYYYKVEGWSNVFAVSRVDLYATYAYDPALLTADPGGFNWTAHLEADGYGGAHIWWTANSPSAWIWSQEWARFKVQTKGDTQPVYNYNWPGYAAQTNWGYGRDGSGGSFEGGSMVGVPAVVPEPATIMAVLAGCASAFLKKRR